MRRPLLLALPSVAACALLVGIEERPLRQEPDVVDGGAEAGPTDPCLHATPPAAPLTDDDDTKLDFTAAIRTLRYDTGAPDGLDLDGTCTCQGGPGAARDGGPSCTSREPQCDFDGGIDNALLRIPFLQLEAFRGESLSAEIACGRGGLVLEIYGYNGRANDTNVAVGFMPTIGVLEPHEATEEPAECDGGSLRGKTYAPRWDGTDRFSPDDRFVRKGAPAVIFRAYVRDWTLVASAEGKVPLPIGPGLADTSQGTIVARVVPLDATGTPLPRTPGARAAGVRLEGVLAGRGAVSAMMKVVERTRVGSQHLCPGTPLYDEVKTTLCNAADLRSEPREDFTNLPCDAISLGLGFVAEPAMQGGAIGVDASPTGCEDVPAVCD
jgi:hypothetical protein